MGNMNKLSEKNMLKLKALEELMNNGHGAACDFIRARLGDEDCEESKKLREKCTWKGWKNIRNKLFVLLLINGFQQDSTQLVADTFMQLRKENASKMILRPDRCQVKPLSCPWW